MVPVFGGHTYSYMLHEPVERTFERMAGFGFNYVEAMAHPGHLWPGELNAAARAGLRRAAEKNGISTLVLNMPNVDLNIASTTPEMRRHSLSLLRPLVELAGDLGAAGLICGPGKANPLMAAPRETMMSYFLSALEDLSPRAKTAGTELWLENMPFGFIPDAPGLAKVLDDFGDDTIGAVYDFTNGYFINEDFSVGMAAFESRLRLVHVSDTGQDVYRHSVLGAGTMPIAPIPGLLRKYGYDGPIMLEIISDSPDADFVISRDRMRSLDWGEQELT